MFVRVCADRAILRCEIAQTGETVGSTTLVPNHSMKRLIDDLIAEGGQGLYVKDDSVKDRTFELIPHKLLIMKCLGPQDSDFNERRFLVSINGAVGGRRQPTDLESKTFVAFTDNTVSRRHFEISYDENLDKYFIRDLGSAGGTFVRIPHGKKQLLRPGMMLLLGKHQFAVSAVDEQPVDEGKPVGAEASAEKGGSSKLAKNGDCNSAKAAAGCEASAMGKSVAAESKSLPAAVVDGGRVREVVRMDAKGMPAGADDRSGDENSPRELVFSSGDSANPRNELDDSSASDSDAAVDERSRLQRLHNGLRELLDIRRRRGDGGAVDSELAEVSSRIEQLLVSESENERKTAESAGKRTPRQSEADGYQSDSAPDTASDEAAGSPTSPTAEQGYAKLRLTCFAPELSPIQGTSYIVGKEGATIGRRSTNTIHFSHMVEDRFYGIDNSISAEHARIVYDENLKGLVIVDGSATKGSTNGTWQRLSPPQTESEPYRLNPKMEVLIGTVRFQASVSLGNECKEKISK